MAETERTVIAALHLNCSGISRDQQRPPLTEPVSASLTVYSNGERVVGCSLLGLRVHIGTGPQLGQCGASHYGIECMHMRPLSSAALDARDHEELENRAESFFQSNLTYLRLSPRINGVLGKHGVDTMDKLMCLIAGDTLWALKGMGKKSVDDIKGKVETFLQERNYYKNMGDQIRERRAAYELYWSETSVAVDRDLKFFLTCNGITTVDAFRSLPATALKDLEEKYKLGRILREKGSRARS